MDEIQSKSLAGGLKYWLFKYQTRKFQTMAADAVIIFSLLLC